LSQLHHGLTVTGPLVNDKIAFTQSFEYRFHRTPISSRPQFQRDMKLEGLNSFSQLDVKSNRKAITDRFVRTASAEVQSSQAEYVHFAKPRLRISINVVTLLYHSTAMRPGRTHCSSRSLATNGFAI
jgi:hypothetical protein